MWNIFGRTFRSHCCLYYQKFLPHHPNFDHLKMSFISSNFPFSLMENFIFKQTPFCIMENVHMSLNTYHLSFSKLSKPTHITKPKLTLSPIFMTHACSTSSSTCKKKPKNPLKSRIIVFVMSIIFVIWIWISSTTWSIITIEVQITSLLLLKKEYKLLPKNLFNFNYVFI